MVQFNEQLSSEDIDIGEQRESDDVNILEKDLQILKVSKMREDILRKHQRTTPMGVGSLFVLHQGL